MKKLKIMECENYSTSFLPRSNGRIARSIILLSIALYFLWGRSRALYKTTKNPVANKPAFKSNSGITTVR